MEFDFKREMALMTPLIHQNADIYVYGCGKNYELICKQFRYLVNVELDDYVTGFIDISEEKNKWISWEKSLFP